MRAGLSFSRSPISLLLRQPLSIKKSYAGAIQYMTLDLNCYLFFHLKGRQATTQHCLQLWTASISFISERAEFNTESLASETGSLKLVNSPGEI
jgi:hypothetical protein